MKKVIIRILGPVIVLGAAWYGYRFFKLLPQRQEHVATTKVRKGDVVGAVGDTDTTAVAVDDITGELLYA